MSDPATAISTATRVTLYGALLNALLALLKLAVGAVAHSAALVADGVHSLSDLATDLLVLLFARVARQAPDADHPYGHERFETLGTTLLGAVLMAIAGGVAYEGLMRLANPPTTPPLGMPVLAVACVSILVNEWIFRFTKAAGNRIGSSLLVANAWHSRTDSLSSVVVLIGGLGVLAGWPAVDALAALGVGAMIAWVGWKLLVSSLLELVDTALPEEEVRAIHQVAGETPGVRAVHSLRSRRSGSKVILDLHIQVDPRISVSEGHHIGDCVSRRLLDAFHAVQDVTPHIDSEDDVDMQAAGDSGPPPLRPPRAEIHHLLMQRWADIVEITQLQELVLHYLGGRVQVELHLPRGLLSDAQDADALRARLNDAIDDLPWLQVRALWYGP
ncbi:MAG: cation diffusion facilitator family transporter [Pseudomonadota bacterium]|nr:cation diffusion facilitator family transporter [Pseudomonadota bacterium]